MMRASDGGNAAVVVALVAQLLYALITRKIGDDGALALGVVVRYDIVGGNLTAGFILTLLASACGVCER